MQAIVVYITFPSKQAASESVRTLLEKRLIACANLHAGIQSIYRWEGQIETAEEVTVIAKSVAMHMDAIIDTVRQMHPYKCPCIVAWKLEAGHQGYLQWIEQETHPQ